MRIFTHLIVAGFCLGAVAQDSLVNVDQVKKSDTQLTETSSKTKPKKTGGSDSDRSEKASAIVQQLFQGMKSPSPVIPPLVDSIEKELKKEAAGWDPVKKSGARSGGKTVPVSKVDERLFGARSPATLGNMVSPIPVSLGGNPEGTTSGNAVKAINRGQGRSDPGVQEEVNTNHSAPAPVDRTETVRKRPLAKLFKKKSSKEGKKGPLKRLFSKTKKSVSPGEIPAKK